MISGSRVLVAVGSPILGALKRLLGTFVQPSARTCPARDGCAVFPWWMGSSRPPGSSACASDGAGFLRDLLRQELRAGLFGGRDRKPRADKPAAAEAGWKCLFADCTGAAKGLVNRPGNTKCYWCCREKSRACNPPAASRIL